MDGGDGVLVVGGSAGGIEALVEIVAGLPTDLPACVLVTVHVRGDIRSSLPRILARAGTLPAAHARHGEPLRRGRIYVAPPDFHLLAAHGIARLSSGPRVNRHRPAIDVMFASAARWAGSRVVAVVLSGVLDDGAVGAALVARAGGTVIVQDPGDALFASMPRAASSAVPAAVSAPVARLAKLIEERLYGLRERSRIDGDGGAVEEGGPQMREARMGEGADPGFLSADEAASPACRVPSATEVSRRAT